METLWQDVKYGARMLAKNPGFTAVAVLSLALGIGVNTSIFSVINAILFKPLPVPESERLASVFSANEERSASNLIREAPMAYPDYADFRDQTDVFEGLFSYDQAGFALEQGEENLFVMGGKVTGNFFTTLRVEAALGRVFLPEEDLEHGANPVAVLSYPSWTHRFGSDPDIVGKVIHLNGIPFTVVGVAPESFKGLLRGFSPELWVPMSMHATLRPQNPGRLKNRGSRWASVMGRLKPGVTLEQAQAQLETVAERLKTEYPDTNEHRGVSIYASNDIALLPGVDKVLYITSFVVMSLVGFILLIACANVANLLLARATERRREMAIRLAMGAGRGRIIRQLVVESLLLASLAAGAALVVAAWSNSVFNRPDIPLPISIQFDLGLSLDWRVWSYTMTAAVFTALFFGLLPALQASRPDVVEALKDEGGRTSGSKTKNRLRNLLVVGQVSLSLVLLIVAGLSVRSLMNAHNIDPGFKTKNLVIAPFAVELRGYDEARGQAFYDQLTERMRTTPGVVSVASALHLPLTFEIRTTKAIPQREASTPEEKWPEVGTTAVSPRYFETMGVPLLAGRDFTHRDDKDPPPVVIINEELAQRYWPGENPLGQTLVIGRAEREYEVVGVAKTHKYRTLGESSRLYVYQSLRANYEGAQQTIVRTAGDPSSFLTTVRNEARAIDPKVPTFGIKTLENSIGVVLLLPRMTAGLFGLFGLLGLLLASVGIYGVIAYTVSQRTHEIGIRMALGAQRTDIMQMVLKQGLLLTGVGVVIGLLAAFGLTRFLSGILYGIGATDILTFAGVSGALLLVALLACYVPARRATKVDPMVALRYE
jgi:predicted permease